MNISISLSSAACKPLVNFQPALTTTESLLFQHHQKQRKDKVVVIMGATGTGKSKLAIDLATHFPPAEIVNSDKMQVYKGLDITTNKVTEEECRGVPHHLLSIVANPNYNFTANDFCHHASLAIDSIVDRDGLPIIAGGSNSFIDALVNHDSTFRLRYECCFLWVDVSLPVLHSSLSARVDRMIEAGQINEIREFFDHSISDYTRGVRRAIGVPEFDEFLREEARGGDERIKKKLLEVAIAMTKVNNCKLANRQVQKIHHLYKIWKKNMHRLNATESVFNKSAWEDDVAAKGRRIVQKFLYDDTPALFSAGVPLPSLPPTMAAVTH
ncbi:hypothetical protein Lal_00006899 [Lupinus albus]|uniref:adenylate dimethylallyltransferase (ADP/ATP-dependent) n=1 Tax=Lupinus albus TaxID=3870 RepID=A0A6A5MVP9_LUPAL|nr:putative transferase [Lupinus albus]KAF1876268.1 hypothetical protein Lal_00006899 [Lupinus albus]